MRSRPTKREKVYESSSTLHTSFEERENDPPAPQRHREQVVALSLQSASSDVALIAGYDDA